MLGWVQAVALRIDALQFLQFRRRYVGWKTSKGGMILINYFRLKLVGDKLTKSSKIGFYMKRFTADICSF